MVTVVSGEFRGIDVGHTLAMVGAIELTVTVTVMACCLVAGVAPGAVTVTRAMYGVAWGRRELASTANVSRVCDPGSRTPVIGTTVSQGAPVIATEYDR